MFLRWFGENETAHSLAEKLNFNFRALEPFLRLTGGPGIVVMKNPGAVLVAAHPALLNFKAIPRPAPQEDGEEGGTENPVELARAQGQQDTDSWERSSSDPRPLKVWVITDIRYDESTLKLLFRMRPMLFDTKGSLHSVGPEEESETLVFTAVLCQETP